MLSKLWREWRFPVEFALLLGLVFFLPLREAPKNLLWLAYVIAWVVNRLKTRQFGGPWDRWDSLFVGWVATGYLAALFAGIRTPDANEWGAVNDLLRYVSLAWCVRRAGYTRDQALMILGLLVTSAALGTIEALWRWKVTSVRKALELVSVGHVNHSAIYLVICIGIGVGCIATLWRRLGVMPRLLGVSMIFVMAVAVLMTDSRAAFVALVLLVPICVFYGFRASAIGRKGWAASLVVIVLAVGIGGIGTVERHLAIAKADNMMTERDLIWNRAVVAVQVNPWFGVGMDNFSRITDERLAGWLQLQGRQMQVDEYRRAPHAHSLYINTITERGAIGLAALLAVLVAWVVTLWRSRPRRGSDVETAALWCAAFSGWFVTVVIGFANTTMHHEHATLAVLTLVLWLARPAPEPSMAA